MSLGRLVSDSAVPVDAVAALLPVRKGPAPGSAARHDAVTSQLFDLAGAHARSGVRVGGRVRQVHVDKHRPTVSRPKLMVSIALAIEKYIELLGAF